MQLDKDRINHERRTVGQKISTISSDPESWLQPAVERSPSRVREREGWNQRDDEIPIFMVPLVIAVR